MLSNTMSSPSRPAKSSRQMAGRVTAGRVTRKGSCSVRESLGGKSRGKSLGESLEGLLPISRTAQYQSFSVPQPYRNGKRGERAFLRLILVYTRIVMNIIVCYNTVSAVAAMMFCKRYPELANTHHHNIRITAVRLAAFVFQLLFCMDIGPIVCGVRAKSLSIPKNWLGREIEVLLYYP
jgi:hypothetical protein